MKAAILFTAIATASVTGLSAFGQSCSSGGGNQGGPSYPSHPANLPTAAEINNFLNGGALPNSAPATPAVPPARVTVVDPPAAPNSSVPASTVASATVRVVEPSIEPAPAPAVEPPAIEAIDPALAGLVGTWRAVARHGDGKLTTIELQLDDRGWAKLTVPSTDGTKSTIKRRVELKDKEITLTEAGDELLLGKLNSFNDHQLVLDRDNGQVTFVRL